MMKDKNPDLEFYELFEFTAVKITKEVEGEQNMIKRFSKHLQDTADVLMGMQKSGLIDLGSEYDFVKFLAFPKKDNSGSGVKNFEQEIAKK